MESDDGPYFMSVASKLNSFTRISFRNPKICWIILLHPVEICPLMGIFCCSGTCVRAAQPSPHKQFHPKRHTIEVH